METTTTTLAAVPLRPYMAGIQHRKQSRQREQKDEGGNPGNPLHVGTASPHTRKRGLSCCAGARCQGGSTSKVRHAHGNVASSSLESRPRMELLETT